MNKLKTDNLNPFYLGHLEMDRWQKLLNSNHQNNLSSLIKNYGLIIQQTDTNVYSTDWHVEAVTANKVSVFAGKALLQKSDGELAFVNCEATQQIDVPTVAGTYKLLVAYTNKNTEKGTVTVNDSSSVVNGTGTEFTKLFAVNRRIIINNIPLVVASVESDTALTLATGQFNGNLVNQQFQVGGWFPQYPIGTADNYIYEYDSLQFVLRTDAKLSYEYWLAEIIVAGGTITQITDKRNLNIFKLNLNVPDIDGTTATTFNVGGRYVLLDSDVPQDILNIRIADVYSNDESYLEPGYDAGILIALSEQITPQSNNSLKVKLKWGWDYIKGVGGSNSFLINNITGYEKDGNLPDLSGIVSGGVFVNNILTGYMLWVPQVNQLLKIVSNTGNNLTVTKKDGTAINLTGVNPNVDNPAWITVDADRYSIVAIPISAIYGEYNAGAIEGFVTYHMDNILPIPFMETVITLQVARRYIIKLKAHLLTKQTDYFALQAGQYWKYGVWQNYDSWFLAIHAQISSTGAAIGATKTTNGFVVTIVGWLDAQKFEMVYTTNNAGANFTDASQPNIITANRTIDVVTSASASYSIKVRPLISGQQVATPLSTTVISGTAGLPGNTAMLVNQEINLRTYSGTLTTNASGNSILSAMKTPAGGTTDVINLPNDMIGKILSINGYDFVITNILSGTSIRLQGINTATGEAAFALVSELPYSFTISTSKKARRIFLQQLPEDFMIIKTSFDCQALVGDSSIRVPKVKIRVYQQAREDLANTLLIEASDTVNSMDNNIQILGFYGARILVVDLFDPNLVEPIYNIEGVSGRLVIYGIPYSISVPGAI